jgi:branched-chain amino acid transport system permease protein
MNADVRPHPGRRLCRGDTARQLCDWKPVRLAAPARGGCPASPIGSPRSWLTLTVAGLAMGMIIFIIARPDAGVRPDGRAELRPRRVHRSWARSSRHVLAQHRAAATHATPVPNLGAVFLAMLVAMAACAALGIAFERLLVRPVYGQHLKQILITMGGMIVGEELIKTIWGPQQIPLPLPQALRGSIFIGEAAIERYRLLAVVVGLAVFAAMAWTLSRTKVGLLIRAGVQDREMVESLGYRIRRLVRRACSWSAAGSRDWAACCGGCTSRASCRRSARR